MTRPPTGCHPGPLSRRCAGRRRAGKPGRRIGSTTGTAKPRTAAVSPRACLLDERRLGACQLDEELTCALQTDCPEPLICREESCINSCVLDRDYFAQLVEEMLVDEGLPTTTSQKSRSKRTRFI